MAELLLNDFRGGKNTDLDPTKLQANEGVVALNIDPRDRTLKKLAGADDMFDSLPSSFTPYSAAQFLYTKPSEQQVTIVYGKVSTTDKVYVRPYPSGGSWVDAWLDLTEQEGTIASPLTAEAGTNTTTIVCSSLSSSDDDYYNTFIVFNITRNKGSYVTDYVGSTNTLTIKEAIASQTSTDTFVIMRFHTHNFLNVGGLNLPFNPKDDVVRFSGRENTIELFCGNDNAYPLLSDYILQYFDRSYFDDSDLDRDGFWFTQSHLNVVNSTAIATLGVAAETQDPVPADDYVLHVVALYDGYQEGPIDGGTVPQNATKYSSSHRVQVSANEKIQISYSISVNGPGIMNKDLIYDFRITKLRVYMATAEQAATGSSAYEITEAFRMVSETKIDHPDWSGTAPYTQTVDIVGNDYANAAGDELEDRQGHDDWSSNFSYDASSLLLDHKTTANAEFAALVGKSLFLASVHIDEKRNDFIIKTPTNSDLINTPNVRPWGDYIDTSLYGIPRIIGLYESVGKAIVVGENKILRITASATETLVDETLVDRGGIAKKGIVVVGRSIYIAGIENIYQFDTLGSFGFVGPTLRKIGDRETEGGPKGGIREEWLAFSESQRQAAIMGYDRRLNAIVLAVSTTIYIYFIDLDAWYNYDGISDTIVWLFTGYDGECIALAGTTIKELFASSPDVASAYQWKTGVVPGPLRTLRTRTPYSGTDNTTIDFYDAEKSTTVPRLKSTFAAQSSVKRISKETSGEFERLQIDINGDSSTNTDNEIESIEINVEQLQKI